MHHKHGISIWFFIGSLLTIYGVLITGAGIYGLLQPVPAELKMGHLHAGIWWGGIMLVLGLVYLIKFRPGKTAAAEAKEEQLAHSGH